jgi:uncharacterized protein (TIGR03435 family)
MDRALKFLLITVVMLLTLTTSEMIAGQEKSPSKSAQPSSDKPVFEVTSIKVNNSGQQGTQALREPGGLYRVTNATLRALVASAYTNEFPPKGRLIFGGPSWIDSERFDIEARAKGDLSSANERLMLQSLLESRFKLSLHHETRQLPLYALTVTKAGKTGPQLIPHSDDSQCSPLSTDKPPRQPGPTENLPTYCGGFFMNPRPGDLRETARGVTMSMLASFLNQSLDRKVLDKTGLDGTFDLKLEFSPETGPGSSGPSTEGNAESSPSTAPSLFTALQEQLGLKLESTKGPVDVLVIDAADQPTEN